MALEFPARPARQLPRVVHDAVEALAVEVDDPRQVIELPAPGVVEALVDLPLGELAVAAMGPVVGRQRLASKGRRQRAIKVFSPIGVVDSACNTKGFAGRRVVDEARVLQLSWIGLGSTELAQHPHLFGGQQIHQVHQAVEHRRSMRLHGQAVATAQRA